MDYYPSKSLLRLEYERLAGECCDRSWERIRKQYLRLPDESLEHLSIVHAYATMRLLSPRGAIRRNQVDAWLEFFRIFPSATCLGDDLINAIGRVLKPKPSKATIYRWGQEIGIPLCQSTWYGTEEVRVFLAKILGQGRFRPIVECPSLRKLSA